jgi:signal peptidase II
MRWAHCFLYSFLVIVIDQLTKYWALHALVPYASIAIFPGLNFTLLSNTGAAFSFLSNAGAWHHWFFVIFTLVVSSFLVVFIVKQRHGLQAFAMSLILGGALGNFIDRMRLGAVVDFIDIFYHQYHWPVFNVADAAITVGACLWLYSTAFQPEPIKG